MISVSNEFWKLMQERTDFKENVEITFRDGTVLELDESVFTTDNNSVTDAAGVNSIPLGIVLSRSIQIELQNDDERFSIYDFFGATIRLYLKFELSESVEKIEYGTFTVVSPATYGETVIIVANDDMYKSNIAYSTNIVFPAQAWEVLQDSCATCGISLSTTEFLNNDFEIQEKPSSDYTHRQIIGYISMIACGNARINRQGYLEILSYDFSFLNEIADGGTFNPWTGGYVADGGTFNPWNEGDVLDGGLFTDKKDYHILYNFKDSPRVDTDDVVITGVQTTIQSTDNETQSKTVLLGQEGYVLKIENPLISGNEEDALQRIGAVMIDGRMRNFEGDHIAYPIAEFMDKAFVVDRKGNTYGTILTDINFTFFGFTTFKNSAENAVRNASSFGSQGVQAIIKARQMVQAEKTARELAVEKLAQSLATSSGMYVTEEVQEDESVIYYTHDKKTLAESQFVWKYTAEAIGISTDGGETYPYGFMVTGDMITKILSAEGINADWIKSGTITGITFITVSDGSSESVKIQNGGVTFYDKNGVRWLRSNNGRLFFSQPLYDDNDEPLGYDSGAVASFATAYHSILVSYNNAPAYSLNIDLNSKAFSCLKIGYGNSSGFVGLSNVVLGVNVKGDSGIDVCGTMRTLDIECGGYLKVIGTKSRVAKTESYNNRLLYCYEMPSPIFGDVGHGVIGEDGLCYVDIDQIFFETIDTAQSYHVFLQSYSENQIYVKEKQQGYFIVKGLPGTGFDWEVKAKQLDYPLERLEEQLAEDDYQETDYVAEASEYLEEYEKELVNYG